jgi:hypothetical protein
LDFVISRSGSDEKSERFRINKISPCGRNDSKPALFKGRAELRTQIDIAHQVGYVDKNAFLDIEEKCIQIGKMLGALIKARKTYIP